MKLIVGLGNPGDKYTSTRHNTGFSIVDKLKNEILNSQFSTTEFQKDSDFKFSKKLQSDVVKLGDIILAKPQTFMNSSGDAVSSLTTFYKIPTDNLWVIHDDLDIKLGDYKIQKGVGPRLHYGVNSIEEKLGTKDFWRVRVGVDNRTKENWMEGEAYVLCNFSDSERVVMERVFQKVLIDIKKVLQK